MTESSSPTKLRPCLTADKCPAGRWRQTRRSTLARRTGISFNFLNWAGSWGYYSNRDTDLLTIGHRTYDPNTGTFLTRDPAMDGRNWYGYCDNNPLKWVDPEGLSKVRYFKILFEGLMRVRKGGISKKVAGEVRRHGKNIEIVTGDLRRGRREAGELGDNIYHKPHDPNGRDRSIGNGGHGQRAGKDGHSFITLIKGLILGLDPTGITDAMDAGEAFGDYIDPYVKSASKGYKNQRIDRWLD